MNNKNLVSVPFDEYTDLLEKSKLLASGETYVAVCSSLSMRSYTLGKVESVDKIAAEIKEAWASYERMVDQVIQLNSENGSLQFKLEQKEKELNYIKSKWWYKFFYS